jgi:hypothetical protein
MQSSTDALMSSSATYPTAAPDRDPCLVTPSKHCCATRVRLGDRSSLLTVREAGDLGQAAEQLLAATAGDREPSLQVAAVVDTLH